MDKHASSAEKENKWVLRRILNIEILSKFDYCNSAVVLTLDVEGDAAKMLLSLRNPHHALVRRLVVVGADRAEVNREQSVSNARPVFGGNHSAVSVPGDSGRKRPGDPKFARQFGGVARHQLVVAPAMRRSWNSHQG